MKLSKKIYNGINDSLSDISGGRALFIFGILLIILNIVLFHSKNGFVLTWLIWEVPLYVFCGWALWSAWKIYKKTLEIINKDK